MGDHALAEDEDLGPERRSGLRLQGCGETVGLENQRAVLVERIRPEELGEEIQHLALSGERDVLLVGEIVIEVVVDRHTCLRHRRTGVELPDGERNEVGGDRIVRLPVEGGAIAGRRLVDQRPGRHHRIRHRHRHAQREGCLVEGVVVRREPGVGSRRFAQGEPSVGALLPSHVELARHVRYRSGHPPVLDHDHVWFSRFER